MLKHAYLSLSQPISWVSFGIMAAVGGGALYYFNNEREKASERNNASIVRVLNPSHAFLQSGLSNRRQALGALPWAVIGL